MIHIKKNKIIFFILAYLFISFGLLINNQDVKDFELIKFNTSKENYRHIPNYKSPFEFLLGEGSTSSYLFEFKIPFASFFNFNNPFDVFSKKAVWLYAGNAVNHGVVEVYINSEFVGEVNLKKEGINNAPNYSFHKIGTFKIKNNFRSLNITLRSKSQDQKLFYTEVGLLSFAPEHYTLKDIESEHNGGSKSLDSIKVVLFLIVSIIFSAIISSYSNINRPIIIFTLLPYIYLIFSLINTNTTVNLNNIKNDKSFLSAVHGELRMSKIFIKELLIKRKNNSKVDDINVVPTTFGVEVLETKRPDEYYHLSDNILFGGIKLSKEICFRNSNCDQKSPLSLLLTLIFSCWVLGLLCSTLKINNISKYSFLFIIPISTLLSLRLSSGWDELYVNLRHSYTLINYGLFSVNFSNPVEATVDTLPLIFTAVLSKIIAINLDDSAIIVSLIGPILIYMGTRGVLKNFIKSEPLNYLLSSFICLTPCVLWVSGSGFFSPIFTGLILILSALYLFKNENKIYFFLLFLIPLIRTEGILYVGLLVFFKFAFNFNKTYLIRLFKELFIEIGWVALFGIIFSSIRYFVYKEILPIPVIFKNTSLEVHYIHEGYSRFIDALIVHGIPFIFFLIIIFLLINKFIFRIRLFTRYKNLFIIFCALFIFSLPYVSGGGDWFNVTWNRYFMPLTVFMSLVMAILFCDFCVNIIKSNVVPSTISILIIVLMPLNYFRYYLTDNENIYNSTYKSLLTPDLNSWSRVENLANAGVYLSKNTLSDSVIGSTEEATISYFSRREMIGFLGVSNPAIAKSKLDPMGLGDILHRKRALESLSSTLPDFLLLFEPTYKISKDSLNNEQFKNYIQKSFFNTWMNNITTYRYGGIEHIIKLGYRPVCIKDGEYIYMIFVRDVAYQNLINSSVFYNREIVDIKFIISQNILERFYDSKPD